ncbi:hypothetical protein IT418_03360 [bacterium]|nr:hypothetical protein [bacterium]
MDNTNNAESFRAFFIDNVSKFCDKCGTAYKPDNIDIVSESNASVIIQAQCDNCKGIYMAHVIKPLQMTKKIPIRLDIVPAMLHPYYLLGPISSDELLALRKKLTKVKTHEDLLELIGKQKKNLKSKG